MLVFCSMMNHLKRILLVDDDPICSWLNQLLLEEMHVAQQVVCLQDGQEALKYLQQNCSVSGVADAPCPELIFLDLNMPGMSGIELLEQLASGTSKLNAAISSVVVLTTSLHPKDVALAREFPILTYLTKPLTKAKVEEVIALRSKEQQPKHEPAPSFTATAGSPLQSGPFMRHLQQKASLK